MATAPAPTPRPAAAEAPSADRRARPAWALPAVVVAVLAVAVAAVVGIRGLFFADPVQGTDASGVTTLHGSFEPYTCGTPCTGYVQAGARSVFVILPAACPAPARGADVTVRGRLDASAGKATYRAVACPSR